MRTFHKLKPTVPALALLGALTAIQPSVSTAAPLESDNHVHTQQSPVPAKLVQAVRDNTEQYLDVNNAVAAQYGPFLGCVSGPDHGAMGIHYVNSTLVGDGLIDETKPEALIYEPVLGRLRLVGVEFIVDAATWLAHNPNPPVLEGQTFNLVPAPNRFNLPDFFELHVWAWRDNPQGAFVDWNNQVSCEGQ